MSTIIPFTPIRQAAFTFQPVLDGNTYNATVTWNLFGQRYYLDLYALDGTLVVSRALVGSPIGYDVSLVSGYFNSTLVYRQPSSQFETNP